MNALLLGLSLALFAEGPGGYARPELLIEATDATLVKERKYTPLDVRGKGAYKEGHLPGARWVDATTWAKEFAAERDPAEWSKRIGALGVATDTPVVVYDVGGVQDGARIWWILRYWGFKDVRLLNGGHRGWVAAGNPLETGDIRIRVVDPRLKAEPSRLATKEELLEGLKKSDFGQIIDTRSEKEYCGESALAKRGGTIPGSKHLEWKQFFDPKTGRFRPGGEMAELFKKAGIDPEKPATTFCQSGGRASVTAFALELMGGKEVRNYYRSWSEWGNDETTPVARPKGKKE